MSKKKIAPAPSRQVKQVIGIDWFYKTSSLIMTRVGMMGFIVISIVSYIFWFVPQEQKNEITNTWILFKCKECQYPYIGFCGLLSIVLIGNFIFTQKALKLKDERIKEITKEKSELQSKLLNKKLNSSTAEGE